MRLRVLHRTEYRYPSPVRSSQNELRLTPRDTPWQRTEHAFLSVLPACPLTCYRDLNGNSIHRCEIPAPHDRFVVESRIQVSTRSKVDFSDLPYGFLHQDLPRCHEMEDCHPFLQDSPYIERTAEVWRQALDIQGGSTDVLQTSYAIMEHIFRNYRYQSGTTTVTTHASEVIASRTGVCQDFAHAMVALCRSLGIPARYVSGYFFDATRDHHLRGAEASHAWVEVHLLPFGWIGLDPTNNKIVDETYIRLAVGRDYRDVAPVTGTYYGDGGSRMEVTVKVRRLEEKGPPSRPDGSVEESPAEKDAASATAEAR